MGLRRFIYKVVGKGDFPFHMLSMSKAWPIDAHAAHRIALSCPTVAPEQEVWLESDQEPNHKFWRENHWPIKEMV